jgi:hypothetical protein
VFVRYSGTLSRNGLEPGERLEEYIDDQREAEQGVGILDGHVLTGIGSKNSKRGALFF